MAGSPWRPSYSVGDWPHLLATASQGGKCQDHLGHGVAVGCSGRWSWSGSSGRGRTWWPARRRADPSLGLASSSLRPPGAHSWAGLGRKVWSAETDTAGPDSGHQRAGWPVKWLFLTPRREPSGVSRGAERASPFLCSETKSKGRGNHPPPWRAGVLLKACGSNKDFCLSAAKHSRDPRALICLF